jgi:hypothetical protein
MSSPPPPWRNSPEWVSAAELLRLHDHTQTVGLLWTSDQPDEETSKLTLTQKTIRTRNPNKQTAADPRRRPAGNKGIF